MSAFIYNTTIYKLYIDCNNYLYLQNLSTSYHKLCILFIFFPPLQLKWIFESLQTTKYWFIFCKLLVYRLPNLMHSPVPFIFYSLLKSTLSILFNFFPPSWLKWIWMFTTTTYWFNFCKLLVYRLPGLMYSPVPFIFLFPLLSTLSLLQMHTLP